MGRRLFGTDGVRGRAGELLTPELAVALARAATSMLDAPRPRVLVIRDTRESGPMLEAALAAGISGAGGDAMIGGVLPTPAAPLLVRRYGFDLAAVISASHNPYIDNGVKFFGADGYKLGDELEQRIERAIDEPAAAAANPGIGAILPLHGALEDYLRELHVRFADLDLTERSVLLDCANGATHVAAPEIFRRLGADVAVLADVPDGRNINDGCGSTSIEALASAVAAGDHELGFAFDGDGDRVLAVDRDGTIVDGDELIALAAMHLRAAGRLEGGVAVTVMTNYGFHGAMAEAGIEVATTPVGDRAVLEALRQRGWTLGGEQSGHIVELGFAPSGDGIASALLVLEALDGADLSARAPFDRLPQRLVNVALPGGVPAPLDRPAVRAAIEAASAELAGRGRVLVRPSGTEPLVRVMAEAPTAEEADAVCARLAAAVESAARATI